MVKIYRFQRIMIIAALIIWAGFAARIVVKGITGSNSSVVDTFCENVYYNVEADIAAEGKIDVGDNSRQTRKMILVGIADKLGINRYSLTEDEDGMHLSQDSANGAVYADILSDGSDEYMRINVVLNRGFECVESYGDIIEECFSEMGCKICASISMKGTVAGEMTESDRSSMASKMLDMLGAKTVTSGSVEDSYMVYAYAKDIGESVNIGKKKINVNIMISYNENEDTTDIQLATPVYNGDF